MAGGSDRAGLLDLSGGGGGGAEFVEIIGSALRMASGAEYRAAVMLEDFEPGGDVGSIFLARLKSDLQVGAQERGTQLGDQFLGAIAGIAPALAAKIAVKARGVLGRVNQFMQDRAVVTLGIAESLEGRHLHVVEFLRVVGAVAAVLSRSPRGSDEGFGAFDALHGVERRGGFRVVDFGQAVDLLDVEHAVAFHVGDFALGVLAGRVVMLGAGDAVGVHDQRGFFAFANLRAQLRGLPVGDPDRGGEVLRHGGSPESENIDAAIGLPVMTQGPGDPSGGVFGVPGFDPRADALFETGDDL